jgi:hypothetical protein
MSRFIERDQPVDATVEHQPRGVSQIGCPRDGDGVSA